MKRFIIIACIVGGIFAFRRFPEMFGALILASVFIVAGAMIIFAPIFAFNSTPIFCIEKIEDDIIHILDKAKKSLNREEWLTFDQIFSLAEASDIMNRDSMRNGYYIALNNLIRRSMVVVGSKDGKHRYRLIVEIDPEKGKEAKDPVGNEILCAAS